MSARGAGDITALANLLRSGLVRNLGNITTTKLFTHAYGGTKLLIDDYITQVALSIQYVTMWRPEQAQEPAQATTFTPQAKLELLHDTRQAFGRTTLLLQGGSAFGLCHLGVVKALHLQGLLPRIITGTATGAMIAALVGVHPESELLPLLEGSGIDLSVFDSRRKGHPDGGKESWIRICFRRLKRFLGTGHLFDMELLEECVRTNVGDLTFEEAYARSKRILNITVATGGKDGTPNLLNYLTAPNVVCIFHLQTRF
jgi:TAG lipase/lysophosphatidylethanolamine acyltransferase